MTTLDNLLDQALDIAGTLFQTDSLSIADESLMLGRELSGQAGSSLSITGTAPNITITGLTGITTESINNFITISGAATLANNGTFLITSYISATSVTIENSSGVGGDANNGSVSWVERLPWSAEDDHNYHRTDRALIKGVSYDSNIPTYVRPENQALQVPANLLNISGKTTDAKVFIKERKFANLTANTGNLFETLVSTGNLKHADSVDITGVPIFDGHDAGNHNSTYAEVVDNATGNGLVVIGGGNAGQRIFARTRDGSSTSPNSVEVEWRSVALNASISTSSPYTWEGGQPSAVDIYYPYRESVFGMDENAFRVTLVNGLIADAGLAQEIDDVRVVIGVGTGDTDLSSQLTNTGVYFPFSDLPDITPSVVEALNTLNQQIGNRTYTGSIIGAADGYTITETLQLLANSISSSSPVIRTIERLTVQINAGASHTLPGGLSYTLDGTDNGNGMWIFWRGILRDPGPITDGNDYEETSTTSFTPYTKIRVDDHINYFISL